MKKYNLLLLNLKSLTLSNTSTLFKLIICFCSFNSKKSEFSEEVVKEYFEKKIDLNSKKFDNSL